MADFFGNLGSGIRFPDARINGPGPLPTSLSGPAGINGDPDGRYNFNGNLLDGIGPYAGPDGGRMGSDRNYQQVPHRVQHIIPQVYLPCGTVDSQVAVSHAVDMGDLAFSIVSERLERLLVRGALGGPRAPMPARNAFVNLPTVNYILAGLQRLTDRNPANHGDGNKWQKNWKNLAQDLDYNPENQNKLAEVLRLVSTRLLPYGICAGSEHQGGKHETGLAPVQAAANHVTTMTVDGQNTDLVNYWRASTINAGDVLILRLEPLETQCFGLNHYYKQMSTEAFGSKIVCWQLVPDVFRANYNPYKGLNGKKERMNIGGRDEVSSTQNNEQWICDYRFDGYWRIGQMFHHRNANELQVDNYSNDQCFLRGQLMKITFAPVWVQMEERLPIKPFPGTIEYSKSFLERQKRALYTKEEQGPVNKPRIHGYGRSGRGNRSKHDIPIELEQEIYACFRSEISKYFQRTSANDILSNLLDGEDIWNIRNKTKDMHDWNECINQTRELLNEKYDTKSIQHCVSQMKDVWFFYLQYRDYATTITDREDFLKSLNEGIWPSQIAEEDSPIELSADEKKRMRSSRSFYEKMLQFYVHFKGEFPVLDDNKLTNLLLDTTYQALQLLAKNTEDADLQKNLIDMIKITKKTGDDNGFKRIQEIYDYLENNDTLKRHNVWNNSNIFISTYAFTILKNLKVCCHIFLLQLGLTSKKLREIDIYNLLTWIDTDTPENVQDFFTKEKYFHNKYFDESKIAVTYLAWYSKYYRSLTAFQGSYLSKFGEYLATMPKNMFDDIQEIGDFIKRLQAVSSMKDISTETGDSESDDHKYEILNTLETDLLCLRNELFKNYQEIWYGSPYQDVKLQVFGGMWYFLTTGMDYVMKLKKKLKVDSNLFCDDMKSMKFSFENLLLYKKEICMNLFDVKEKSSRTSVGRKLDFMDITFWKPKVLLNAFVIKYFDILEHNNNFNYNQKMFDNINNYVDNFDKEKLKDVVKIRSKLLELQGQLFEFTQTNKYTDTEKSNLIQNYSEACKNSWQESYDICSEIEQMDSSEIHQEVCCVIKVNLFRILIDCYEYGLRFYKTESPDKIKTEMDIYHELTAKVSKPTVFEHFVHVLSVDSTSTSQPSASITNITTLSTPDTSAGIKIVKASSLKTRAPATSVQGKAKKARIDNEAKTKNEAKTDNQYVMDLS